MTGTGVWLVAGDGRWVWSAPDGSRWCPDGRGGWSPYGGPIADLPPVPPADSWGAPPAPDASGVPSGTGPTATPHDVHGPEVVSAALAAPQAAPGAAAGWQPGGGQGTTAAPVDHRHGHREERAARRADADRAKALAAWQERHDAVATLLERARTDRGTDSADGLLLKTGEHCFCTVAQASLVEDRRGPGHYAGRSQGFSIPVASIGGHSIRYRVGASKGTFVQGTPVATSIDTGTMYVTDQRVVFAGSRQTRECAFGKLVGFTSDDDASTTFSVSNRQKPVTVHYGEQVHLAVRFFLELAYAHFNGTVDAFVSSLESQLAEVEAQKPA